MLLSWEVADAFCYKHEALLVSEIAERIGKIRLKKRTSTFTTFLLSLFKDDTRVYLMSPSSKRVKKALEKLEKQGYVRSYIDIYTLPHLRRYCRVAR
jgi:rhodanese-related sulfurtransferase